MIYLEFFTRINTSLEEVFERLTDIEGYNDWLPKSRVFLECHQTSEGPVKQGTTLFEYDSEMVEYPGDGISSDLFFGICRRWNEGPSYCRGKIVRYI